LRESGASVTFRNFFQELFGYYPFPWQLQMAKTGWRDITAPTGTGKTAIIAAWFWKLANNKDAPTRLIYLVDRRMIVDDVYRYAASIAQSIADATDGPLKEVGDQIRDRFGVETPVFVARLRGGTWRDETWAQSPKQPLVIASTVDQAGSRLLGRGYGCSRSMQIVSCGLLGNDSLFVVDEAHLSQPFVANLRRVISMHKGTIQKPPVLVEMTATPQDPENTIGLVPGDKKNKELQKRISAKKPTELILVSIPKNGSESNKRGVVAMKMISLCQQATGNVVGVVCNSVALARQVHERLESKNQEAILLTGRSRPHQRDLVFAEYRHRIVAGRDRSADTKLFVVATQCIEAGVDLDVDELITELAPLDSLRQRAGRLNRLGELENCSCKVVARNDKTKKQDSIYGDALKSTWRWLSAQKANLDLGLNLKVPVGEDLLPLLAPTDEFSLLEEQDVEQLGAIQLPMAFSLDSFLHGKQTPSRTIGVCWRYGLGEIELDRRDEINSALEILPPRSAEICPVPIWEVRRWLGEGRAVVRWAEDGIELISGQDLSPRDTIVVPTSYGGCDRWGWHANFEGEVEDIADDVASRLSGRKIERVFSPEKPSPKAKRFAGGWLVIGDFEKHPLEEFARVTPESNEPMQVAVSLDTHCAGVAKIANDFAPQGFEDQLRIAGELHDAGKCDRRWQYAISGGEFDSTMWAKSGDLPLHRYLSALRQSGLPKGWRHETLSLQLAEQVTQDELILHLVICHHGWGHPWPGNVVDPEPPAVDSFELLKHRFFGLTEGERIESQLVSLADRCAIRFKRIDDEFGIWQRCFLEGAIILADWRCSAMEREPQATELAID